MFAHLLLTVLAASGGQPEAEAHAEHICWMERVEVEDAGVRIVFTEHAPVEPEARSVHAEIGTILTPAVSPEDGCRLTVQHKDGVPGVLAEAHFFARGITPTPELRSEWIAATPAQ